MENKTGSEEIAAFNDQAQKSTSPHAPFNERPTEVFIADNAAAISELSILRAPYAAGACKMSIIPSTPDRRKTADAPAENNTSDNTSIATKSLVKNKTHKIGHFDED
ncbi:hypothetical protein TNCV_1876441 [Trichonephila clavipes]|nr:hypothetical protein TNCV_1876441 [Trichonephila clavipes]